MGASGRRKVGFNDSFGVFAYVVILSAPLLFMMEAIMLMVGDPPAIAVLRTVATRDTSHQRKQRHCCFRWCDVSRVATVRSTAMAGGSPTMSMIASIMKRREAERITT